MIELNLVVMRRTIIFVSAGNMKVKHYIVSLPPEAHDQCVTPNMIST